MLKVRLQRSACAPQLWQCCGIRRALAAGEGEARSVEGQVQQLLHDAQDPEKLSRMYVGWASWV